jgi:hypothetical protein
MLNYHDSKITHILATRKDSQPEASAAKIEDGARTLD